MILTRRKLISSSVNIAAALAARKALSLVPLGGSPITQQPWTFSDLVTGWNNLVKEDDGGTGNTAVWSTDATRSFLRVTSVNPGTFGLRFKHTTPGVFESTIQYDIRRSSNLASKQLKQYGLGQATGTPPSSNSTFGPTMGGYAGTAYGVYYGDFSTGSNDATIAYATSGYPTNNLPAIGFGGSFSRTPYPTQLTTIDAEQNILTSPWETWTTYFRASSASTADGQIAVWKNGTLVMYMTDMWNCNALTRDRGGFALYEFSSNSGFVEDYSRVFQMFARPINMGI